MREDAVIAALADHWEDTAGLLDPGDLRLLREAAQRIRAAGTEGEARPALGALMTVLAARLPRDHPVRRAMPAGGRLAGGTRPGAGPPLHRIVGDLDRIPDLRGPFPPGEGGAEHGSAGGDAAGWLLSAPALGEREVRERGCDPAGPGLIRLTDPASRIRLPAFQFGNDGQPLPVVLTINRMLDADDDPWGVADWWLGRNAWLRAVPAGLLGSVDDTLLVAAARAELPEE